MNKNMEVGNLGRIEVEDEQPKTLEEAVEKLRGLQEKYDNLKMKFHRTVKWIALISLLSLGIEKGIDIKIDSNKNKIITTELKALADLTSQYEIYANGVFYAEQNGYNVPIKVDGNTTDNTPSKGDVVGFHKKDIELSEKIDSTLNNLAKQIDIDSPDLR